MSLSLYQYWLLTTVVRPDTKLRGLLGDPFVEVAPQFVLNVLDFAILLLVRPAESTYHGLRKPWLEWIQRGAVLPVLLSFGWLLGYRFGAQGMIWTQILGGIAALVAAAFLLRGRLDSIPTAKAVSEP